MKKILNDPFIIICIIVVLYFAVQALASLNEPNPSKALTEAQMNYLAGERTLSVEERKKSFNAALKTFLQLEKNYTPTFGNGKLYYDIGNTFFQLEEYPEAILYYYRAQKLRPTDDKIHSNLSLAQSKLTLTSEKENSAFDWLFFFHRHFSLPERLQLFSLGTFVTFLLFSLYLWFPKRFIYAAAVAALVATVPFLLSVSYTYAFSPIEAVMVKSSLLYRDAGEQYAKVQPEPIPSGLKVQILDLTSAGKWLKIRTDDGTVGFVPDESIRTI